MTDSFSTSEMCRVGIEGAPSVFVYFLGKELKIRLMEMEEVFMGQMPNSFYLILLPVTITFSLVVVVTVR